LGDPLGSRHDAEADAASADPGPERDAAVAHLEMIDRVTAAYSRCGALAEVWPVDLAAQLDRFHGRDARPRLREALAGWDRLGHVPNALATRVALAEGEAAHGDRNAAREHLARAREIATTLEADPMLERIAALEDRHALASRERRPADVLTDREAEVLVLLADGRTNAEIATTLFMSPKTASVHVSRIITKLGAGNRTEAAALARRQGLLT
jgi:DNA-binding CsgD family transcriptional regulator